MPLHLWWLNTMPGHSEGQHAKHTSGHSGASLCCRLRRAGRAKRNGFHPCSQISHWSASTDLVGPGIACSCNLLLRCQDENAQVARHTMVVFDSRTEIGLAWIGLSLNYCVQRSYHIYQYLIPVIPWCSWLCRNFSQPETELGLKLKSTTSW